MITDKDLKRLEAIRKYIKHLKLVGEKKDNLTIDIKI
jgi:hypothetical protein